MLERIDVVYGDEEGEHALSLPLLGATPRDSILVKSVTGLNPPGIDLFLGEYARDGGNYQGRRAQTRNPVLTLDLNPNPALGQTVAGLRSLLYKAFIDPHVNADHSQLILREDDGSARYLVGYTEKFETDLFGVETSAQISMLCPDPFIRDLQETVLTNPFGWITVPFAYAGDAETGFEVDISINVSTPVLTLENNGRTMVMTSEFKVGDLVHINTSPGSWSITLTRSGITTSLLPNLATASRWLELHSQANTMRVYGSTVDSRPATITELRYTAAYWGI